jgi:PTH1 family peptidyl-tRNA hydrolase
VAVERINYLIVGLGNPGKSYANTLHNIGFEVNKALAKKYEADFKENKKLNGLIARSARKEKNLFLFLPLTFMNDSGSAVRACKDYYKIEVNNLLVLVDDVDIDFGEYRMRKSGRSGGHNGLKSIEEYLGTQNYSRLRIGVGQKPNKEMALSSFVLGKFTSAQKKMIPSIIEDAINGIELWMDEGIEQAMNVLNIKKKKIGEEIKE